MPIDAFSNPDNLNVVGPITVNDDAQTGAASNIVVAGTGSLKMNGTGGGVDLRTGGGQLILKNGGAGGPGLYQNDSTGTKREVLYLDGSNNTNLLTVAGQTVKVGDVSSANFLTASAALMNILATALQLSPSATIPTPTGAAQTIATNTGIISRTAPSGACTGAIMQAGTVNGQLCIVTNENVASTTNIITFSATIATANVINDGTNPQVVKCGTAKAFIWLASLNSGSGAWVALAPFAG